MIFEHFVVGALEVNCYLIGCDQSKEIAVIDPGGEADKIFSAIEEKKYKPKYLINTHGHIDHIAANKDFKERYNIPLMIHSKDSFLLSAKQDPMLEMMLNAKPSPPADEFLEEGQKITIGSITLGVIHTPGHSPGSICLTFDEALFTGDTLFAGGIGRTDLPGGSYDALMKSIKEKVLTFDRSWKIYPGHGPFSTVGEEDDHNPFLREDLSGWL